MICYVDLKYINGVRFRLKATLEKEKIDHEEALTQQKKEYMTEIKVECCLYAVGTLCPGILAVCSLPASTPRHPFCPCHFVILVLKS